MRSSGNTILITGGASGLGLALARKLIAKGNVVIICGRDSGKLDQAKAVEPRLVTFTADVADSESRSRFAEMVVRTFPRLNILVNNAGQVNVSDVNDTNFISKLEAEAAVNFIGPTALVHSLLPTLKSQSDATIVNITTGYVFLTGARTPHYSATKTAMHSMTQSLRYQLKRTNVRIVEIMPPPVDTDMASHYPGSKARIEPIADKFIHAMLGREDEAAIGISKLAKFLGRFLPGLGFKIVNDSEFITANNAALKSK